MFYITERHKDGSSAKPRRRRPRQKSGGRPRQKAERRPPGEVVISEGCLFSELPLDQELLEALKKLRFEKATPIQSGTIPVALEGRDLIGQAQTGSGKTAAYALGVLQRLESKERGCEALVVCPTRELAVQVTEEFTRLAACKEIRLIAAVGGHDITIQSAALAHGVDVVVGTPGRLLDLMYRGVLDLGAVRFAVIDEADEMLKMGFIDDVEMILSCLPPERQTLLFSATMPERVRKLAESFLEEPAHITVENTRQNLPDIDQLYLVVKGDERDQVLRKVLDRADSGKTLIFCRTKSRVHRVQRVLTAHYSDVGCIEGDMPQRDRDRIMRQFRRGQIQVLIATDVLARGIDVQDVTRVINYDCPRDADSYVHRVGRTARAGSSGTAVTFIEPNEKRSLQEIEERVGKLRPLEDFSIFSDPASA